jgi:hypothetical protein
MWSFGYRCGKRSALDMKGVTDRADDALHRREASRHDDRSARLIQPFVLIRRASWSVRPVRRGLNGPVPSVTWHQRGMRRR